MNSDQKADLVLNDLKVNVIKTKSFYDGSNRLTSRYEAVANADNGVACLRTDYTYVGATTQVDASKESISTWNSSWDI